MNRGTNQTRTVEWYTWEIDRLEQTIQLLLLMEEVREITHSHEYV